jgi:hypothetical protein
MKTRIPILTWALSLPAVAAVPAFDAPQLMVSPDGPVKTESPGYACPAWTDMDGDGKKDLLVGQFRNGKIKVYPGLGGGKIGKGEWLKAGGEVATVPGVW